jgi:hypothetical protein
VGDFYAQISTAVDFSDTVFDTSVTGVQWTPVSAALTAGTTYYWRACASNAYGYKGTWSTVWSFTTAAVPAVPTLQSPADLAVIRDTNPLLWWAVLAEVPVSYGLQVSTASDFTAIVVDTTAGSGDYVMTLGTALTPGVTYYWRMNASNQFGSSDWSSVLSFTIEALAMPTITADPAPFLSFPVGTTVNYSVAAAGNPDPTYQWQQSPDGVTWTDIAGETGVTFSFTSVIAGDIYFRVVAHNSEGNATSAEALLNSY